MASGLTDTKGKFLFLLAINFVFIDLTSYVKKSARRKGIEIVWRDTGLENENGIKRSAYATWAGCITRQVEK